LLDAQAFESKGEFANAIAIYQAVENDPDLDIRCEARFRHGRVLERLKRPRDAAELYRAILDVQPTAQRVRLELARVYAEMGDSDAALRALRQVRAGRLPQEVSLLVDTLIDAAQADAPVGGNIEFGISPDTNINRATRASTIDTVIAPFDLSKDARVKSGVGVVVNGSGYLRHALEDNLVGTLNVSSENRIFRERAFDDQVLTGQAGLSKMVAEGRLNLTAAESLRWFGEKPLTSAYSATLELDRPTSETSRFKIGVSSGWTEFLRDHAESGRSTAISASWMKAFTPVSGGRLTIAASRQDARDPGYATTAGVVSAVAWWELLHSTAFAELDASRLQADRRLLLYPSRRSDWLASVTLGVNLRFVKIAGFSPTLRFNLERNTSTVGIYRFERKDAQITFAHPI
jgi:hypothetical protein